VCRARPLNEPAWEELYRRYYHRIRRRVHRARRYFPDSEVEDVTMEVFETLWSQDRGPSQALATWLYTLADHRVVDRNRFHSALKRRGTLCALSLDDGLEDGGQSSDHLPTTALTPPEELERAQLQEATRAAVQSLPKLERRIVELYYYYGLSDAGIARRLKMKTRTVSHRRSRALEVLKPHLAGSFGDASYDR